jgi:tRNA (cytidine/uridine-2'-O-)-methyltransferase
MIHVVLFEPEIPPNTGNVIRLCANTGATLHLVKPLGFRWTTRACSAPDSTITTSLMCACTRIFDACWPNSGPRGCSRWRPAAQRYSDVTYRAGDAFVFGPETRGLPDAVLERIGRDNSVYIPMRPGKPQHQFVQRGGHRRLRRLAATGICWGRVAGAPDRRVARGTLPGRLARPRSRHRLAVPHYASVITRPASSSAADRTARGRPAG